MAATVGVAVREELDFSFQQSTLQTCAQCLPDEFFASKAAVAADICAHAVGLAAVVEF